MNTKHTKTPYEVHATGTRIYASEVEAGEQTPYRPRRLVATLETSSDVVETARFIVQACNMHDELVATLKEVYAIATGNRKGVDRYDLQNLVAATLAKLDEMKKEK